MSDANVDAVIVGAGLAGLYQLYRLRGLGLRSRVFEAGGDVGGTWYWNRYPGARCDIDSMSYSYSFSPELEQEWRWTEKYPAQPEVLRYIRHVAERFDLRKDVTFNTRVASAIYNEARARWTVTTSSGEAVSARFVIMATGCLSTSKEPEVPGKERFAGPIYHTAHWPDGGVDFTGLRVGVIGTGSSGIQCIPVLARQAADLTVFQRTPNFSLPAGNRALTEDEIRDRRARAAEWRQAERESLFGVAAPVPTVSALQVSSEERNATYQRGWDAGGLVGMMTAYADLLIDRAANDTAAEFIRQKIHSIVQDPEVAESLSPRSYAVGSKRLCLDTGYYETFNQPHVHLVDLRKTPLVEITERGVRTSAREHALDAIVFATGFDAMTGTLLAIDIRGVGGASLRHKWANGPRTYLGLAIAGFPNLFTITGPSSPSVLSNMVVSIEQHVDWITDCIAFLRQRGVAAIDATREAEDAWAEHVELVGNATVYPSADSWYMGSNVPGKPRVFMAYIGGVGAYRQKCDEVARNGYEGFALVPEAASPAVPPS